MPTQVLWSVTIIIHLFVLDYFIFEASHEEDDVIQLNQLNDAGWILSGELSSLTPFLPTNSLPPPPTPLHLVVSVERRLMNSKILTLACWLAAPNLLNRTLVILYIYKRYSSYQVGILNHSGHIKILILGGCTCTFSPLHPIMD